MRRRVPSFSSRDPGGEEQCRLGNGEVVYGPDVCFLLTSFISAVVTSVECSVADKRLRGRVAVCFAENPISKP